MPKATKANDSSQRHNPLADDLIATGPLKQKTPKRKNRHGDGKDENENYVDSRESRKILRIGQELADEEEAAQKAANGAGKNTAFDFESRFGNDDGLQDDDEDEFADDGEAWGDEEEEIIIDADGDMAPEDRATFMKFFPGEKEDELLEKGWPGMAQDGDEDDMGGESTNLADLILAKIAEHEAEMGGMNRQQEDMRAVDDEDEIPEKVVEVYTKIGFLLSRYKSGPLPKPFKILPTIPSWERIIQITRPDSWTPNAVYEATKIFISSTPVVAQTFLQHVLLPCVRDDINETKKLNIHLFKALKKGLYKPAAWFKGLLFPLIGSGTCTLREATIISAALVRVSVPVLHSAAALKGLCDIAAAESRAGTEGGGATNIFIRCLLEKKYALPYQVIDALVFHFLRFKDDALVGQGKEGNKLPVIWHQCLLAFAQRYRNDITEDQREALLDLLTVRGHGQIGPEVRRELLAGRGRGVPMPEEPGVADNDDTMMDM
jgi:essential nuclear protein 1